MHNGILIIDKPAGLTSHDVVSRMRRILKTKKIGHTGTLDPFATGVLVMLVGKATRLAQFLDKDKKTYEALINFGFETDTGDKTGAPISDFGFRISGIKKTLNKIKWEHVFKDFVGEIKQIPPMYSAKKVKGKKLYELARKGVEIERKPVKIKVYDLALVSDPTKNRNPQSEIRIRISCSAGTYIRTLAEDLGRKIGVPCHLAELRRTKAGKFSIAQAFSLEELEKICETGNLDESIISLNEAVSHLPEKNLEKKDLEMVKNGRKIDASFEDESVLNVRLTDAEHNLAAIGEYDKNAKQISPRIVFIN